MSVGNFQKQEQNMGIGNRIFLIGYMGCGKTTLGQALAERLGCSFLDVDTWISDAAGKSIPQIFAEEGEARFREWEGEALEEAIEQEDVVVATGGGMPCFEERMDTLLAHGTVIYLELKPETLLQRLSDGLHGRPLLAGLSQETLLTHIEKQLEQRQAIYKEADMVLDASPSVEELCTQIQTALTTA